jgi:hypothetical protein
VSPRAGASTPPTSTGAVAAALTQLGGKSIFFGHQSVGYNILEGVQEIAARDGRSGVRIVETAEPGSVAPGVLAHATVGQNGDPSSKIKAFQQHLHDMAGKVDVAVLKFCYIDVNADTDVQRLFEEYRSTMRDLGAQFPSTRFVHVTMPLRTVQTGPKALLKRTLGRPAGGYVENAKRNVYNELLRREYAGKAVLFDLADVESRSDGNHQVTFAFDGREFRALNPDFTSDNGHLNPVGRRLAAEAFVQSLADASGEQH